MRCWNQLPGGRGLAVRSPPPEEEPPLDDEPLPDDELLDEAPPL